MNVPAANDGSLVTFPPPLCRRSGHSHLLFWPGLIVGSMCRSAAHFTESEKDFANLSKRELFEEVHWRQTFTRST